MVAAREGVPSPSSPPPRFIFTFFAPFFTSHCSQLSKGLEHIECVSPPPPEINDGSCAMVNTLNFRFLDNPDPVMRSVWIFEENACEKGFS